MNPENLFSKRRLGDALGDGAWWWRRTDET
jgi:hypothetical protein